MKNAGLKYGALLAIGLLIASGTVIWKLFADEPAVASYQLFDQGLDKVEQYATLIKEHVLRFFSKNDTCSYASLMREFQEALHAMHVEFLKPLDHEIKRLAHDDARKAALKDMHKIVEELYRAMQALVNALKQGGNKLSLGLRLKNLKEQKLAKSVNTINRNIENLIKKLHEQDDHDLANKLQQLKKQLEASFGSLNMGATEILDVLAYRLSHP